MDWTNEQKQAIEKNNSNILVAAAAGSGKTAVLVERIIQKIVNNKIDIDKILVVTFTNAAASEMRDKILEAIYQKIDENPDDLHLKKQTILLKKSNICTIHSFCLDIIKNNFFEIDISSNFRIATEEETELLKQECLDNVFEKLYEQQDEEFEALLNTYTGYRDDIKLKEIVLKIHRFIQSMPFPKKWLEEAIEEFKVNKDQDFLKTKWGKVIFNNFVDELEYSILILEKAKNTILENIELNEYIDILENDIYMLKNIKYAKNLNWDKIYEITNSICFDRWKSNKKTDCNEKTQAKNLRDEAKKNIDELVKKYFVFSNQEALDDIFNMYNIMIYLKNLIFKFDIEFKDKKKQKNILDFNDIEHYALDILVKEDNGEFIPTDVAKRYKEKFCEIAIDEYQDSNNIQEYILKTISNENNIFMVGDVKQSIYKFRQACPDLFLEKYNSYSLNKSNDMGLKIQLFKNFRSRENVLNIVNIIFKSIMSSSLGDNVDYTEEEFLNKGAIFEPTEEKSEICIIDLKDDDDDVEDEDTLKLIEKEEIEAKFVAQKIEDLIKTKKQVTDKKTRKLRDITYKDIVILLRSTNNLSPIFEKELLNRNIPVYSESSSKYLDTIEIQSIINLLKIIDNPINDIALVSVLRGPIYSFTDNEIFEIRLQNKKDSFYYSLKNAEVSKNLKIKIEKFMSEIDDFRFKSKYMSISELIWDIFNKTKFYDYCLFMPNGELRQANLKMLLERAKEFENTSYSGLYNFIKFLENLKINNKDLSSAKIIGENENVVRIMSIHKSKGLEFPYVFLSTTNKKINLRDLNENILLHQKLGIGPEFIDYNRRIQYSTSAKLALKLLIKDESIAEEMRVLYVALTRAKDKLIITGTTNNYEKKYLKILNDIQTCSKTSIHTSLIKKYTTYLDWIQLVYLKDDNLKDNLNLKIINKTSIDLNKGTKDTNLKVTDINIDIDEEKVLKRLEWKYNFINSTKLPLKTSVSILKQYDNNEEELFKENQNQLSFIIPEFVDKKQTTSARVGTAFHVLLQNIDFNYNYEKEDIIKLKERLINDNKFTEQEAKFISEKKILNLLKSDLGIKIKKAKQVFKETAFCLKIPASRYFISDKNDNILVQGIIDLYFIDEDGNIFLIDYKTDKVQNKEELKNKYNKQLEIYKLALEKYYKKSVYKAIIYSLFLDDEIEV